MSTVSASDRTAVLLHEQEAVNFRRTDRLFGVLMLVQWAALVVVALAVSPRTWAGAESAVHVHLWTALGLGGLVTLVPAALAWRRAGAVSTRLVIAASQALVSALIIHLSGGRIESHFHIFASLAILAFYHDPKVLLTATVVVAADHVLRGLFWPESAFGVFTVSVWRIAEHAGWVVFEVGFLLLACRNATRDKRDMAEAQAGLEAREAEIAASAAALETEKTHALEKEREAADLTARVDAQRADLAESVDAVLEALGRLAAGDLTAHLTPPDGRDDEVLRRLFEGYNRSTSSIRALVADIQRIAADATRTVEDITTSTESLAAGARAQSAQTEEVAAAVEEMTRTIIENAQNATRTADAAQEGGRTAENGSRVVRETMNKMKDIAHVVGSSAETVSRLGASSEEIGQIVQVIEEIADQTNLLALNAAIEAARAGDQGRGFAVVADEVRKLAERTAVATKEIAAKIRTIQDETGKAVEAMEWGRTEVEQGLHLADEASTALGEIVGGTRNTVDLVMQIAAASEEQSTTSEQIARNVTGISRVADEAAHGLGAILDAVAHVNTLTASLDRLTARFNVNAAGTPDDPLDQINLDAAPSPGDGHTSRSAPELGR